MIIDNDMHSYAQTGRRYAAQQFEPQMKVLGMSQPLN